MMNPLTGDNVMMPLVENVPPLLLEMAFKGLVVLGIVFLLAPVIRRLSASIRCLVWTAALAALLALPLFTPLMPPVSVEIFPLSPAEEASSVKPAKVPKPASKAKAEEEKIDFEWRDDAKAVAATPRTLAARASSVSSLVGLARNTSPTAWLIGLWLAGVLVVMARFITGAAGVWWLLRRTRPVADPSWLELADQVRALHGIRRRVTLVECPRALMPLTWGIFRPVVLLPADAGAWDDARRRCVLMHEYAHIRRLDCLAQGVGQVACALHWFNPLAWWVARRMRIDREHACDDYVLAGGGTKPSEYARHLLEIASTLPSAFSSPLAGVAMARPSSLEGRIRSILDSERRRQILSRTTISLVVLFSAFAVLPVAALRTWVRPGDPGADEKPVVKPAAAIAVTDDWAKPMPGDTIRIEPFTVDIPEIRIEEIVVDPIHIEIPEIRIDPIVIDPIHIDVPGMTIPMEDFTGPDQQVFDRTFDVRQGASLRVKVEDADIEIAPGPDDQARIEVFVADSDPESARASFEEMAFDVRHEGNLLTVTARSPSESRGARMRIAIPRQFNVDLATGDGDIVLADLEGKLRIQTRDGDITTGSVEGASLEIVTGDGDLVAGDVRVDRALIETDYGDISLGSIQAGTIQMRSGDGDVVARHLDGDLILSVADGNISIGEARGRLAMQVGDGDIALQRLIEGAVHVKSAGGDIALSDVGGPVEAVTDGGDIALTLSTEANLRLKTLSGDIAVGLAPGAGADVDLRAGEIHVPDGPVFKGTKSEGRVTGEREGGGARVQIDAGEGAIALH